MSHRPLIYTPSGRAGEYHDKGFAANLFKGCDHGCLYCYAPRVRYMQKEKFHAAVIPVPDLLERITKDCEEFMAEPIFLCFLCDPYPNSANARALTREAIKIILKSGNSVNILTKGGMRATQDFDLLYTNSKNKIGATLTFATPSLSEKWEPHAALPDSRIAMLAEAKVLGIATWASVEPVIDPEESLAIMSAAAPYVDEFKVGKWNHDARAKEIDWKNFYQQAKMMLDHLGKKAMFKKDLLEAAGVKP